MTDTRPLDDTDPFDRDLAESFAELRNSGRKARIELLLGEEDRDSAKSVAVSLYVAKELEEDSEVRVYDNPSEAELREVLACAADYSGDWYHSQVTLHVDGEMSPLESELVALPKSAGVSLMYAFHSVRAMAKHLGLDQEVIDQLED